MSDAPNPESTPEPDHIKQLRADAEAKRKAEAERDAMARELAFTKAGVDTSSKPAQALLATYAGELTSEAILAEAKEWGLVSEPGTQSSAPAQPTPEQLEQQRIRDQLQGQPAPVPDPPRQGAIDRAFSEFHEDRKNGMPLTKAQEKAFATVIDGAARGDSQAIFDPIAWAEQQEAAGHGRPRG